jgi:hypothetical protein
MAVWESILGLMAVSNLAIAKCALRFRISFHFAYFYHAEEQATLA